MKTILNKTHKPLKVPLPRGKVLHLGPHKEGQIADPAVDHPPFKALMEAGEVEIVGEGERDGKLVGDLTMPHESTHGHTQKSTSHSVGNR